MVTPTFIDLNPDELHYYPFIISMNRFNGSWNTVEYPFGRMCVSNKMEDMSVKVLNTIKGINESKHISRECKCEVDGKKCNSKQKCSNDKFQCECKRPIKHSLREEDYA